MPAWGWILLTLTAVAALCARPVLRLMRRRRVAQAQQRFRMEREQLEAKFFDLAARNGKPRGLRWIGCDWQQDVTYGRDIATGLLTAFVSVEIRFEAIEGSDMVDVAAVGAVRDASAVFHFHQGHWGTGGKALFNLNPAEAIQRLEGQVEPIATLTASSGIRRASRAT